MDGSGREAVSVTGQLLTLNAGSSSIKFALFDPAVSLHSPEQAGHAHRLSPRAIHGPGNAQV